MGIRENIALDPAWHARHAEEFGQRQVKNADGVRLTNRQMNR